MEKMNIEQALLCALFLDEKALPEVMAALRSEMFSDVNLGFIYSAFVSLYSRGEQPDMMLVETEMKKTDMARCKEMGGLAYLSADMAKYRLEHNVVSYAQEIKRLFMLDCLDKIFKKQELKANQYETDYMQLICDTESCLLALREDCSEEQPMVPLSQLAAETIDMQRNRMKHKIDPYRIRTGIHEFDGITGGLYMGEVVVLGGLTSDGKTSLAMFMAMHAARAGRHVLHFSYEMTGLQTMNRFFAGYSSVEADRLRIGGLQESDLAKMEKYAGTLQGLPYYFVNPASSNIQSLRAQIQLMHRKGQCDLVVVDYLHQLVGQPSRNETMESLVNNYIRGLKKIATELNCAILVLSQLNRDVQKREDHIPVLSDLRDSGAIEQVADNVVVIHRPGHFREDPRKQIKLYILKTRNGSKGIAELYHNESFTYFWNPDRNLQFAE